MHKIAIVGPSFFSYMQAIRDEFIAAGIASSFFDERHSNTIISKILYRLRASWLIAKKRKNHLDAVLNQIIAEKFTDVLFVDVEVVDQYFVDVLQRQGIKVHIYMWDSSRNKDSFTHYLPSLSGKGSFDFEDCKKLGMEYIPLFAENQFSEYLSGTRLERDIDVSFCGTLHSNRAFHLKKLYKLAAAKNMNISLMVFFHSRLLLLIKSFSSFSNFFFVRKISTLGFPKKEVSLAMRKSQYVFDMQHQGQGGLTARTFEALRSGAKLLTFNKNIFNLPSFYHDRILLINSIDDLKDMDFNVRVELQGLDAEQDYYLSLSRFADQLLGIMGIPKNQERPLQ